MERKYFSQVLCILILTMISIGGITMNTIGYAQPSVAKSAENPVHSELDNIKQTLNNTTEAINLKDVKKLATYFSKDFTLITLENKKIAPLQSFVEYFEGLFKGDKATVKNLRVEIQIDPEPIYLDKKIAIIQGSANEEFTYFKGEKQVLHTRWTAVLEKNSARNTEWEISAMHHSSGITKSMLNDLQSQMLKTALGGLVIGLVLGMLFISLSRKTKR